MFGRLTQPQTGTGTKATAGPAYLRSLLTHQTRWSTIRQTIDRLLSTDDVTQWSPTAVLDFLTVCLSHPRLYQGREQKKPKVCYSMNPHSSPLSDFSLFAHLTQMPTLLYELCRLFSFTRLASEPQLCHQTTDYEHHFRRPLLNSCTSSALLILVSPHDYLYQPM